MSDLNMGPNPQTCESVAYVPMKVSTPIDLKPFVRKLPISACICEEPQLTPTECGTFILTQKICFEIGIEIGVDTKVKDPIINPKNTPDKHIYTKPNKTPFYNHWYSPNIVY